MTEKEKLQTRLRNAVNDISLLSKEVEDINRKLEELSKPQTLAPGLYTGIVSKSSVYQYERCLIVVEKQLVRIFSTNGTLFHMPGNMLLMPPASDGSMRLCADNNQPFPDYINVRPLVLKS